MIALLISKHLLKLRFWRINCILVFLCLFLLHCKDVKQQLQTSFPVLSLLFQFFDLSLQMVYSFTIFLDNSLIPSWTICPRPGSRLPPSRIINITTTLACNHPYGATSSTFVCGAISPSILEKVYSVGWRIEVVQSISKSVGIVVLELSCSSSHAFFEIPHADVVIGVRICSLHNIFKNVILAFF